MRLGRVVCAGLLAFSALAAAPAAAGEKPSLTEVDEIYAPLRTAGLAMAVAKHCPEIDRNRWRMRWKGQKLFWRARRLGYSRDEIEALIDSASEKERMRNWVYSELDLLGVWPERKISICAFGRDEIAAGTLLGSFLAAR